MPKTTLVEKIPAKIIGGLAGTAKPSWISAVTSRGAKSTQPPSGATYPRVHPETSARNPSLHFGSKPNTSGSRAAYHLLHSALPSSPSNRAAANRGSITSDEVEHLTGGA
ncbi:uncharacterized protein DS421_18g613620 [Arachis hypogaea]|nr:uncharacterized protein DS421_18g613620 [Arachis hypogaea]